MKRVMILGGPGSGKSTLARILGDRLGLPVYHMDLLHWQEDWVERPREEKIPMARAIEEKPEWIFEGGMSATYETRLARADTVIWLDLPVGLRLWRVTKRMVKHFGQARPDLPNGCVERMNLDMLEFYRFIWTTRKTSREKIEKLLATADGSKQVTHLRSPSEVSAFINSFNV